MPYYIKFDFDCENEPPKVEIANLARNYFPNSDQSVIQFA